MHPAGLVGSGVGIGPSGGSNPHLPSSRGPNPAIRDPFPIKDLEPNQKSINLHVIVLEIGKPNQTKDGHEVRTIRVADRTGSVNLSLWNEYGAVLREGDILRLNGCFTQIWKSSLQVKVGNKGQIIKIGEFCMTFSDLPDMSILSAEVLKEIQEQQQGTSTVKQLSNQSAPPNASNNQQPLFQNKQNIIK
jgi:ssDNA-binding replication factor A large subunit